MPKLTHAQKVKMARRMQNRNERKMIVLEGKRTKGQPHKLKHSLFSSRQWGNRKDAIKKRVTS